MTKREFTAALITLMLLCVNILPAQTRQTRAEYIARYKQIAIDHMEKYGIPASITMAQGILESDCGNSTLSTSSNNHFGIKCKSDWRGRTVSHDDDEKGECFRAYDSVEDSYEDHAIFLDSSPRYDSLFSYSSSDYRSWARGLKAAGYATSPTYAELLIKIIEDEKLHLLDLDNGANLYANRNLDESDDKEAAQQETSGEVIDPNNYNVTINAHKGYNIERTNGLYFTRAKEGDTIEKLSEVFDISARNLRKFNDLSKEKAITKGDIIFIERKKAKWEGDEKRTHQTMHSESLYSISQKYGIRLRRLAKLNGMKSDATINVSQIIIIR
ncbi:MAG: glucosaminidase domain-containing protein [Rikenellaceae bacterium]